MLQAVRDEASLEEMSRKKAELEQRFGGEILLLPFVRLSLSSSEIRERIKQGKSIRYMVPDSVLTYIEERGLYRE